MLVDRAGEISFWSERGVVGSVEFSTCKCTRHKCLRAWLFPFCLCCPVINWQPVQVVPPFALIGQRWIVLIALMDRSKILIGLVCINSRVFLFVLEQTSASLVLCLNIKVNESNVVHLIYATVLCMVFCYTSSLF